MSAGRKRRFVHTLALLVPFAGALAGCGFSPMYADGDGTPADSTAIFDVAPASDRATQILRNELLRGIAPEQARRAPWLLDVSVREEETAVLSSRARGTLQKRYRMSASFELRDKTTRRPLLRGKSFADAYYTITRQHFADINARMQAQRAAARQLADDLRTRIAARLARRNHPLPAGNGQ